MCVEMYKLANISSFESLQTNANSSFGSDVSVFNALTLTKASPAFDQIFRIVMGGRDKEAQRILSTIKQAGPDVINAFVSAYQKAMSSYAAKGGGLSASDIIDTDQNIRRIYESAWGKYAPMQDRTRSSAKMKVM